MIVSDRVFLLCACEDLLRSNRATGLERSWLNQEILALKFQGAPWSPSSTLSAEAVKSFDFLSPMELVGTRRWSCDSKGLFWFGCEGELVLLEH